MILAFQIALLVGAGLLGLIAVRRACESARKLGRAEGELAAWRDIAKYSSAWHEYEKTKNKEPKSH